MSTRSLIQIMKEQEDMKMSYQRRVESLMDRYDMNNIILDQRGEQILSGYLVKESEYVKLNEAIRHMGSDQVLLIESGKFTLCRVYEFLSDVPEHCKVHEISKC